MSGRWVDTMKTPPVWRSKYTARGYEEPQSDEACFAATATNQGIRMLLARCLDKRDQGREAFVADYTQAFFIDEVSEGERLYVQPRERWNPKILMDADVWCGNCARPCWVCEDLRDGFIQGERDPCLFANTETGHLHWGACGRLAVGPSDLTNNLLQELAKDMAMRWGVVTGKPQEFLGRPLCRTPQGYKFGVS